MKKQKLFQIPSPAEIELDKIRDLLWRKTKKIRKSYLPLSNKRQKIFKSNMLPMLPKTRDKKIIEILIKHKVDTGYLFGSQAKGTTHEESDLDIAIVFNDAIFPQDYAEKEDQIRRELLQALGVPYVDIVNVLTAQDPLLKHNAVFSGQRLINVDRQKTALIEKAVMDEYEDTRHLRATPFVIDG